MNIVLIIGYLVFSFHVDAFPIYNRMSLWKILLIVPSSFAVYIATSPPNRPSSDEEVKPTAAEHLLLFWMAAQRAIILSAALLEIAIILSSVAPLSALSLWVLENFVLGHAPMLFVSKISITTAYLIGWFLLIIGSFIRQWCYLLLGTFFTFKLSIRKDHTLITSGPYSIVRHPSYTGGYMAFAGATLCCAGRGSWARECTSFGYILERLMWTWWAIGILLTIGRMRREDDMMKREFGREWEEWRKAVPWKVIPGVY